MVSIVEIPLQQRVSAAAHAKLPHANPLSPGQIQSLIQSVLAVGPTTALDVGCGPGAIAIALATQAPIEVAAVDQNPLFIQRARTAAASVDLVGSITFIEGDVRDHMDQKFDAVICMGSSHALGIPRQALETVRSLLTPDGVTLIGEVVWAAPPPQPYLSFLGITEDFYWAQTEGVAVLGESGLELVAEVFPTEQSWQDYERAVLEGRLSLATMLPAEDARATKERAETWFETFEKYGRHVMGFAGYVARRNDD